MLLNLFWVWEGRGLAEFANEAARIDLSVGSDWGDNNPKRFILSMIPTSFRSVKMFPPATRRAYEI